MVEVWILASFLCECVNVVDMFVKETIRAMKKLAQPQYKANNFII